MMRQINQVSAVALPMTPSSVARLLQLLQTLFDLVVHTSDTLVALSLWMPSNRLRLNSDKTEFIRWLGSRVKIF